jgi:hypothetical protein
MNDRDIERAFESSPPPDRSVVEGISERIVPGLGPVRPLPEKRVLILWLMLAAILVAVLGAAALGFNGIQKLTPGESILIFVTLGVLLRLAGFTGVAAMIPGERRLVRPAALVAAGSAVLIGVFALLFHDYSMDGFVPQGLRCLKAGLLNAVPAVVLVWVVLRRGFVLYRAAAAAAAGTLAGLAGLLMLEIHCPNFKAPHVMVWHVAVVPIAALAGWVAGRLAGLRARSAN